jgi:NodT family efflux transporter outer membrane factor (OMF) lipoprotein
MPNKRLGGALLLLLGAGLAGCSLAPDYQKPALTTPVAYSSMGPWAPASPNDAAPRGDWWVMFNDPVLNQLEMRIDTSNPDLAAALSRYDAALQSANEAESQQYPLVDLNASATQNRQSEDRPLRQGEGPNNYGDNAIEGSFFWELDLWGRIRNLVAQGKAQSQASAADAGAMRLSLEARLADAYFNLRGEDAQEKLLSDTSADYARALQLTQDQHEGGIVSGLDVGQAQTQYDIAEAQLTDAIAQRAIYLHEIASLIGVPAPSFVLATQPELPLPPAVPVAAPSDLLQRRPDIASAERKAAAANAQIGVARAAFFPTISIDASGGWEAEGGGINLFNASNTLWSLGPGLALTLFDGGERRAADRLAVDQFNEMSSNYRSVVLTAFQQVEDNLVLANDLATEAAQQADAVKAAANTTDLSMTLYQGGATTYLQVVTAQAAQLSAQRTALAIATRRLQASVNLIQALGGGWTPQAGAGIVAAAQAAPPKS